MQDYPLCWSIFGVVTQALFSFFLVVVGTLQYCVYHRQAGIMDRELGEMQAQRRPWASITSGELESFGFQENSLDNIEATAFFRLAVHNTGATPALHVRALARFTTAGAYAVDKSRAFCAEADRIAMKEMTVFPNEVAVKVLSSAGFDGKEIHRVGESILPNVFGCLCYTDSLGNQHHTGFTFDVYRAGAETPNGAEELPIPVEKSGSSAKVSREHDGRVSLPSQTDQREALHRAHSCTEWALSPATKRSFSALPRQR